MSIPNIGQIAYIKDHNKIDIISDLVNESPNDDNPSGITYLVNGIRSSISNLVCIYNITQVEEYIEDGASISKNAINIMSIKYQK